MHEAQRLDTLLEDVTIEVKVPAPGERVNILLLGPYNRMSAYIVRKDVPVCGGGFVHILDNVLLPHAM